MASDNKLLRSRKQRYKIIDSNTKEVLAEGFTSQKAAMEWRKQNVSKHIKCTLMGC